MPLQRIEEGFVDIHGSSAFDLADKGRWTAVFNQFKLINGFRENALVIHHFYGERPRDYAVSTARPMLCIQFFCEDEAALVTTALFRGRRSVILDDVGSCLRLFSNIGDFGME